MTPRKDRRPADPRHCQVRTLLSWYWTRENPQTPTLPWGAAEAGCVGAFLRANPDLSTDVIKQCLQNRLASDDHAPGEGIYRWFRDLLRYHAAPLDRYRLPKRIHSEATVGQFKLSDPDGPARDWFLDRARQRKARGGKLDDIDKVLLAEENEL